MSRPIAAREAHDGLSLPPVVGEVPNRLHEIGADLKRELKRMLAERELVASPG